MLKRIVNVRPLFLAAIGIIIGIYVGQLLWVSGNAKNIITGSIIFLITLLPLVVFIVLESVLTNKTKLTTFLKFHKKNVIILLVFLLLGNATMAVTSIINNSKYKEFSGQFTIVGEIEDNYYEKNNITVLTINDVLISNNEITKKIPSRVRVVLFETGLINEGSVSANNAITITAELVKVPFLNVGYNFSNYISNTVYSTNNITSFNFHSSRYKPDELIRNEYKTILHNSLPNESANIAYSLLFGNDEALSQEIMQLFTYSGVVHIISVSGLHVAVLVLVLSFILHKLKTNKYAMLAIMFTVLVFYSYLCGFVPSVIRSALMSMVFLLSLNIGEKYDALSSLSLSAVLILLFSPMELFSLGFILSFVSMFALITIAPMLTNLLKKLKVPNIVASPISLTLSATLLTLPIIAHYFNEVAIYSVFSNLIAVPLLSLAYILVFTICTFAIAIPFFASLLIAPQMLIHFSKIILQVIIKLPYSVITVFSDGFISLIIILILAFTLKFVMLKPRVKTVLCSALCLAFILLFVFNNLPNNYNKNMLSTVYQTNSNYSIITTKDNEVVLVGGDIENLSELKKLMINLKLKQINAILSYDYNFKNHNNLIEVCKTYNVTNLYVASLDNSLYNFIENEYSFINNLVIINNQSNYNYKNINFNIISEFNDVLGIEVQVSDNKLLFLVNGLTKQSLLPLRFREGLNYNYVIINNINFNLRDLNINLDNLITHKNNLSKNVNVYSIWNLSNFTIDL